MSYTTITDLRKRISEAKLVQLTDFGNNQVTDTAVVTAALNSASAIIDSYCAARYSLPLAVSDQVKDLELVIGIYKLHEGRQLVPDQVRQSFEDAVAFLKDVSAGKASLDQATVPQTSGSGEVVTRDHDTSPYAFDSVRLDDWIG